MSDLPADWAIEKALCEVGELHITVEEVRETLPHGCYLSAIVKLARYIEAHEKPPVDRKLRCAREAVARIKEKRGKTTLADSIRAGEFDHGLGDMIDAITLWEDGFGKDPETTAPKCQ